MDDEKIVQAVSGQETAVNSAAPAEGQIPPKKKKKRPVDGSASAGERTASAPSQSGDVPHKKKKKRPVDGSASTGERTASAPSQSGDVPHKKKKKRPVDGSVSAAERTAPHKKKRPVNADVNANAERRAVSQQRPVRPRSAEPVQSPEPKTDLRSRILETVTAPFRRETELNEQNSIRLLSTGMFLIFLVLFVIVLALVIRNMNRKANRYLSEYESARPQYTIEEYIAKLDDSFRSDMMSKAAAGLTFTAYEKPEMLYETVRSQDQTGGSGEYTYQRAEDFSDSVPSYYILQDGTAIAKVGLTRIGWTDRFNFPVWHIDTPVSVVSLQAEPSYTLTVTMPEGAVLQVNGVNVPEEDYLEAESDFRLNQTELYFMKQPKAQKCVISGLYCAPEVTVTDADGNKLEPDITPEADHADQEYVFPIADEKHPDPALTDRVTALTKAYMDYVMNTNCDLNNNLAVLANYMVAGSPASTLMYNISTDIWYNNSPDLREDHVFEITHVKQYADNLCTVDVHLESTIGKVAVNEYAGTIRWVMVNTGYGWYATSFTLHP